MLSTDFLLWKRSSLTYTQLFTFLTITWHYSQLPLVLPHLNCIKPRLIDPSIQSVSLTSSPEKSYELSNPFLYYSPSAPFILSQLDHYFCIDKFNLHSLSPEWSFFVIFTKLKIMKRICIIRTLLSYLLQTQVVSMVTVSQLLWFTKEIVRRVRVK